MSHEEFVVGGGREAGVSAGGGGGGAGGLNRHLNVLGESSEFSHCVV